MCYLTAKRNFSPEIRKATLTDLDEIYKIEVECFVEEAFTYSQLKYCLRSPDFVTLIALINGEALGFIIGSLEGLRGKIVGHVYTLDVKRKFRRIGIGSALLEAIEKIFISKGAKRSYLEVRLDNIAAKRLYLKHCYRLKKVIRNYYGPGLDAARFEKDLRRERNAF